MINNHLLQNIKTGSIIIFILTILLCLQGCLLGSTHSNRGSRGSLGDAMEKASDDYDGDRTVPAFDNDDDDSFFDDLENVASPPKKRKKTAAPENQPAEIDVPLNPDESDGEISAYIENTKAQMEHNTGQKGETSSEPLGLKPDKASKKTKPVEIKTDDDDFLVTISGGIAAVKGNDFYELNHVSIAAGFYDTEHQRIEGYVGMGWGPVLETSELDKALDGGVFLISMGLKYKLFTTPRHTFLGQYFIAGAALHRMFWQYENELTAEEGESITGDYIDGLELYGGIGIHLAQTKSFQIGLEAVPSVILWDAYTSEGFDNDVFGPFWMVKFNVTFTLLPD